MKILYLGDIMGKPGRETVKTLLPDLIKKHDVDFVIAQGENLSHGKGMQIKAAEEMMAVGVNFFTGGNWTTFRPDIHSWLNDPSKPVIRPANYKEGVPGLGWKVADTPFGRIQVISLLGQIVGAFPADVDNPLHVVDAILEATQKEKYAARIVNFHGDFSSEKLVIGQYLDGRVTAVIGDHWHTPTADAKLLAKGTAHISDVGMVGSKDSCLGIESDIIIKRWLTSDASRNELETEGAMWLCAVLIEVDPTSNMPKSIRQIIEILDT